MSNPFHKLTTPKNSRQLLHWFIFEPLLFEQYENTLTKTQIAIIVLKAIFTNFFVVIIPLTLVSYAVSVIIIAAFDLPLIFPPSTLAKDTYFNEVFVQQWQIYSIWWEKAGFFASFNHYESLKNLAFGLMFGLLVGLVFSLPGSLPVSLVFGLAVGLAFGLAVGLAFSLIFGLVLSLAIGLAFGLALGLAFGLAISLAFGIAVGLAFGLAFNLASGLTFGLAFGLVFGLVVGSAVNLVVSLTASLTVSLTTGLIFGLALPLFFYLSYFRLWLYPWHFFKSQLGVGLTSNPYIGDGAIWLPIWGITRKLAAQAQQDPKTSLALVDFLQKYRPLQIQLAMHIAHAATAGNWQHHPLQRQYLSPPPLIRETPRLMPSKSWLDQIEKLNQQFEAYEKEHQPSLKKEQLEIFCMQLAQFRDLTEREPYRWHHYYLPAIDEWQIAAKAKLAQG